MERYRFPRISHLPWSEGVTDDDKRWDAIADFIGHELILSEKLDGENTSIYSDGYVHARSPSSRHHPSRTRMKALAAQIAPRMPEGWRISGENMTAWHSIYYRQLPSFFFVFAIYDEDNICIAWDDVKLACQEWGLHTVPVLWQGHTDEQGNKIKEQWNGQSVFETYQSPKLEPCGGEGYVVRKVEPYSYSEAPFSAAKFVRKGHVTTSEHWMTREVIENHFWNDLYGDA